MYFVDRKKLEATLHYMDKLIHILELDRPNSIKEKLCLERAVHVFIESTLDVGNMMIDGFIMRDPGSYHDIIDILLDEKVLPPEKENAYKELITLRRMLISDYANVDHDKIMQTIQTYLDDYKQFSTYIRNYLTEEHQQVTHAFTNGSQ
ncbi:hypothetical protein J32TS6_29380 [Virgibacillus pantothenticus]|uniref:DUF86 domain-containing protein n=1 Tax=Virgibacillus pantothenticus TaxID=1473 RepID=A0A0L0QU55_VIRPA|nr:MULTISPECIES: DUF86 domain-containing protein [Virgibacillus]API90949.1 hypothetical protein BKP57_03210 [Virgibacillus sp. 6R]KNE22091.1 hypothetical protein AFK71_04655 [Virgibacillus pantothenticus]MBS7428927.1 DUF86 domain-containing protein [Virgibacillus sp. 19R1-5]MBU8566679.1 DUF86 domain-containing protein [Virgibacillus pantothenticus]MBU8600262.1 DUF86 domain-containing protein [Virgibacillus pantothenticus]